MKRTADGEQHGPKAPVLRQRRVEYHGRRRRRMRAARTALTRGRPAGLCPPGWLATRSEFNRAVAAQMPSLLLAGSCDPITPPDGTRQVAERLTNATFLLIDPVGHGVTGYNPCITRIEVAFLDNPRAHLDTKCAAAILTASNDDQLKKRTPNRLAPRTHINETAGTGSLRLKF
jgi:pimeloyl-ACP methyl ester carboxylesterase